ncbi:MAG TPA: serpin family protein, partial [Gemmataceae bacterium]|nr:serpin family protein [Gemmataceae bacterium]
MYRWLWLGSLGMALVLAGGVTADKPARKTMTQVAKDNNAFAFSLYGKLRDKKGNLFFSPDSISIALAMTYDGARGETAEQMAHAMHFTLDRPQLNKGFGGLLQHLNG